MFKIGDKVRRLTDSPFYDLRGNRPLKGMIYEVSNIRYNRAETEVKGIILKEMQQDFSWKISSFELIKESIMFKVGDAVRCLEPTSNLTKGKIYTVFQFETRGSNNYVYVEDDTGNKEKHRHAWRFELAKLRPVLEYKLVQNGNRVTLTILHQDKCLLGDGINDKVLYRTDDFSVRSMSRIEISGPKRVYLLGEKDFNKQSSEYSSYAFFNLASADNFVKNFHAAAQAINKEYGSVIAKPIKPLKVKAGKLLIKPGLTLDAKRLKHLQLLKLRELWESDKRQCYQYALSLLGFEVDKIKFDNRGYEAPMVERAKYLKRYQELFSLDSVKKPGVELGEYLGIEIECLIPRETDLNKLKALVVKHKIKNVNATYDGSIQEESGFWGNEFRVVTKNNDFSNLKALTALLTEIGAKVNKSCGLHVHLDMRNADKLTESKNLLKSARRLGKTLPVLLSMQPESRRNNRYCRPGVSKLRGDRYYAINKTAFNKHKTLEVRLHSGTINFNKIYNWCRLLSAIAGCNKLTTKEVTTANELFSKLALPNDLKQYVTKRVEQFSPSAVPDSARIETDIEDGETGPTLISQTPTAGSGEYVFIIPTNNNTDNLAPF